MSLVPHRTRQGYGCPTAATSRHSLSGWQRVWSVRIALLVVIGLLGPTNAALAQNSGSKPTNLTKFAPDLSATLQGAASSTRFPVLVQADRAGLETTLQNTIVSSPSAGVMTHAPAFNAIDSFGTYTALLTPDQIAHLAASPHVLQISPDRPLHACQDFAVQAVGADVAWSTYGVTGKGVTVAILDTGLSPGPDLALPNSRIVGWLDLVGHAAQPYDDNGHGTHVAGILAGNGFLSMMGHYNTLLRHIAPDVSLVSVKVLDKTGSGSASTVIAGINWCIAHKDQLHIRVLNLSLGHPVAESYQTDPLCQACERAWKAGIVVVCAAGNQGRSVPTIVNSAPAYGTIVSPGNDPYVLTVGATNTCGTAARTDDVIASYSSRGPSAIDLVLKPDIVAPGNNIDSLAAPGSLLYTQYSGNWVQPSAYHGIGPIVYFRMSGTSMAAPVVAGAAALLLQADPTLTPNTVKARLMVSADKSRTPDPFTYGAGYLNIPAALACRLHVTDGALSPTTSVHPDGMIWIADGDADDVWGDNAIWGSSGKKLCAIWGVGSWVAGSLLNNALWTGGLAAGLATDADMTAIMVNGD